ncbi:MAG: ABC transporter permease subunit [Nocardioides sp.]
MSVEVLKYETRTRRAPVAALTAALSLLTFGALGAASGLESTVADLTEGFPEALMAFIPADVPGGYVVGEVFNLIAPLMLVAYAVMAGASIVAGEEETGTMSVLASMPLTRRALLMSKAAGVAVSLVMIISVFAAVTLTAEGIFDIGLTTSAVLATCLQLLLLGLFFGALGLAVGASTGNRQLASMVAGGLAAVAYLCETLLPLADLDALARFSPWHYYSGTEPLAVGLDATSVMVLSSLTAAALATALIGFEHRDLKD